MRVWDVSPRLLCRKHLLGEHRELHAIWTILTLGKKGYREHPETKRWVGKLNALYQRHQELMAEMSRRGYRHHSELDKILARGTKTKQDVLIDSIARQKLLLKQKPCGCFVTP